MRKGVRIVIWQAGRLRIIAACLALLASGLMTAGCSRQAEPVVAVDVPLAEVNGEAITQADFAFEVQRRLETGRPLGEPDAILRELAERRIMLQKAEESGMMADPLVQRELENQKLARWLERTLQARKDAVTVSDGDLRQAYEADLAAHTRSARVRLAILYRRLGRHDSEERRATLRAELEAARERYLADPDGVTQKGRIPGFGTVAADASEDTVSRYRGGDLGWLERGRTGYRWPDAVTATGFALPPGQPSDVLATGDGFYVVMKTGEREPRVTPFEEAAVSLRRQLLRERQEAVEQAFKRNLLASAEVRIDAVQAARLELPALKSMQPPTLTPQGAPAPPVMLP